PRVKPSSPTLMKYVGPLTKLTASQRTITPTKPAPRAFTIFGERMTRRTLVAVDPIGACDSKPQFAGGQCPPANCSCRAFYLPSAALTVDCFGAIVVTGVSTSVAL